MFVQKITNGRCGGGHVAEAHLREHGGPEVRRAPLNRCVLKQKHIDNKRDTSKTH